MVPYPESTIDLPQPQHSLFPTLSPVVKSMQILGVPHIRLAQKGNISYFRLTDDITVGIACSVCKASHVVIPTRLAATVSNVELSNNQ